jgi:hypothetical protein
MIELLFSCLRLGQAPAPGKKFRLVPSTNLKVVPWMSFDGLLDTAFEQIRHYGAADIACDVGWPLPDGWHYCSILLVGCVRVAIGRGPYTSTHDPKRT